jgi:hypothetical protein
VRPPPAAPLIKRTAKLIKRLEPAPPTSIVSAEVEAGINQVLADAGQLPSDDMPSSSGDGEQDGGSSDPEGSGDASGSSVREPCSAVARAAAALQAAARCCGCCRCGGRALAVLWRCPQSMDPGSQS